MIPTTTLLKITVAALSLWLGAATGVWAGCDLSKDNADAVILTFDVVDAPQPRATPLLTLYADGRALVPLGTELREGALALQDLKTLLQEIDKSGFSALTTEAIAQAIAPDPEAGQVNRFADGATSFVSIDLPECTVQLTVPNSALNSLALPEADTLQVFRAVELRLLEIVTALQTR